MEDSLRPTDEIQNNTNEKHSNMQFRVNLIVLRPNLRWVRDKKMLENSFKNDQISRQFSRKNLICLLYHISTDVIESQTKLLKWNWIFCFMCDLFYCCPLLFQ